MEHNTIRNRSSSCSKHPWEYGGASGACRFCAALDGVEESRRADAAIHATSASMARFKRSGFDPKKHGILFCAHPDCITVATDPGRSRAGEFYCRAHNYRRFPHSQ